MQSEHSMVAALLKDHTDLHVLSQNNKDEELPGSEASSALHHPAQVDSEAIGARIQMLVSSTICACLLRLSPSAQQSQ